MGDVARVELGAEDVRRTTRFNGKEGLGIGIIRLSTANPLEVSQGVRDALPDVLAQLPEGMTFNLAYDASVFIDESIQQVVKTLVEATILVVLVICAQP